MTRHRQAFQPDHKHSGLTTVSGGILLPMLLLIGCSPPHSPADKYSNNPPVQARAAFDDRFGDKQTIEFLSWDGVWIGSDCDVKFVVAADGSAKLTYYGNINHEFSGRYYFEGGRILLDFPFDEYDGEYDENWPPLILKQDGEDLLLIPAESTSVLDYRGIIDQWPLRSRR